MEDSDEFYLSSEDAEWIGLKKSEYLSDLIQNARPDDFPFEDHYRFDHLIPETVQTPDQTFQEHIDGIKVRTYIRSYLEGEKFHQIVIGGLFPEEGKPSEVFVPILTFVTKFEDLAESFCRGEIIQRPHLQ